MFAAKLLRKNKKIRQACKVEGENTFNIFVIIIYSKISPISSYFSLNYSESSLSASISLVTVPFMLLK